MSLSLTLMLTGCDAIYDDEGDCTVRYHVAFRYTNNILEADAFSNQVKSVTLLVYDKQGNLVTSQSEAGEALKRNDYTMTVDVQPGTYDLIAWCGLEDGGSFVLNGGATPALMSDAKCRLTREYDAEGNAVSNSPITPLFHAINTDVDFPDTWGDTLVCTMNLTKDTNTIRVVLTQYYGGQINPDDFTFSICDDNGYLAYDNSPIADEAITYTEWTKKSMDTDPIPPSDTRATIDNVSSMIAEIDMSRLMADRKDMRLVISVDGREEPVLSLPLIQLLLYAKGEARSQMSDQRYLDVQDEYNLIFFINDDNGWYMNAGIFINGWHMRYQSADA